MPPKNQFIRVVPVAIYRGLFKEWCKRSWVIEIYDLKYHLSSNCLVHWNFHSFFKDSKTLCTDWPASCGRPLELPSCLNHFTAAPASIVVITSKITRQTGKATFADRTFPEWRKPTTIHWFIVYRFGHLPIGHFPTVSNADFDNYRQ